MIAVVEPLTVLALRAHYTMDVFAGILAAAWTAAVARRYAPLVDLALSGQPNDESDRVITGRKHVGKLKRAINMGRWA